MFILYLCITVVMVLFMVYMIRWYMREKDISSLTSEADGEIVKVTKQNYKEPDSGEKKIVYTLKVAYFVDDRQYKTSMCTYEDGVSFQEGQSVTVLYDENRPRHSYVKGDKQPQLRWRNYMIGSIILFVVWVIVFIMTMPLTLGFTRTQKERFNFVMHIFFFLFSIAGLIIYPRTKEYKKKRENGISARKELGAVILIICKTGFDLIWDLIEMLLYR
ncbi:DUF3592 domain-containing protein [Ruminococcus sp.]|uniref:DUF3592 domain-containing protein n=1 Tax=Ruminococcus sp. TaxID=41978 RepID=UPI0025F4361C|nr:DUF3592 domain-containing protein [Ruminococcus sp.]